MKLAALFSGGKDSTYAVYIAQRQGWNVEHLVSISPVKHSMLFHEPNIEMTALSSRALGIRLVSGRSGEGEDKELRALRALLEGLEDIDGIVTGAVASEYQRSRFNGVCEQLGLKVLSPLWRMDGETLLRDMVGAGFEVIFVGVYAEGLDQSWLGRELDSSAIDDLVRLNKRYGINVSGEGGEFETLVLDGPNFDKRLVIMDSSKEWSKDHGILRIKNARLSDKEDS